MHFHSGDIHFQQCITFYPAAAPENGPLAIFVHGWPEVSICWRNQLPALAALGFRTIGWRKKSRLRWMQLWCS
jgi:pimeloyl-ACP methyl ester carboxylesterase